jgi:hypothetical protein
MTLSFTTPRRFNPAHQESTHEELLNSLRATLREALALNKEDALAAAGADFQEEPIAI